MIVSFSTNSKISVEGREFDDYKKEVFENLDSSIVSITTTMKIVEELRAKATIAKQNKDEKAERLALDSIISMFAWRNDHMWEIADYLYFKKLEKSLKDSSSETTRHLISKMNK